MTLLHADLRGQSRQLNLLWRLVEDISSELALQPLLTRIVAGACQLIGADDGTIGLYEAEHDGIRTVAVYCMPEGELGALMRRGVGLAGHVLATGQAALLRYGDLATLTLPELADNQVAGIPIRWAGELIGFFGIGAAPPRRFRRDDVAALELFARHAAIAIANARRYEDERRRTDRFRLIASVAAIIQAEADVDTLLQRSADAIHELLGFENVDIPLRDEKQPEVLVVRTRGGNYKQQIQGEDRIPVARGIMGAAVREQRTQLVNDVAADPRYITPPGLRVPQAELAVPLRVGEEVIGVLNVEGSSRFDELDVSSLEIVADFLAMAVRNLRLASASREIAIVRERQNLGRELHDNVTQVLSAIGLLTQTLSAAWQRDPAEGRRRVERLHQLARTAHGEMRNLLRELQPPSAPARSRRGRAVICVEQLREHDLPGAVKQLLKAMVPEGMRLRLDFAQYAAQQIEAEAVLLRCCQEAVSNAIRHSRGKRLWIVAAVRDAYCELSVADDGIGLAAAAAPGMGFRSMRERAEALAGDVRIGPRRPRGTRVCIRLPRRDRPPP
ncbi:histidine kinase/DNA gyrase B/HSP90-like ATPase [Tahibacter aquaticus]|uniref:Histidine kinase/DNA gyrase B/HSP90-like ATPase n=1 Tax=Tahibacter aquaticus TaxID=520092 RepID=A0A4R6Z2D6_9GAMM|nr:GAF domain-containing protein [Tahibacter aquaticus]TDR45740.1 histidine kinase/DNA gyrase B/HSP90-like ATPase [Tahibacter aquaticus]